MAADPIEYRVVRNLQAAVKAISQAGGYHYDVAAVAVKLDPNGTVEDLLGAVKVRPFVLVEVLPDAFSYKPSMRADIALPFVLHAINDSDPTVDEDWVRVYFNLCADLEQAATRDITRGGLAQDTRLTSREYASTGGRQVWAKVSGSITVARYYGSPNG